jgi:hypothetical protein
MSSLGRFMGSAGLALLLADCKSPPSSTETAAPPAAPPVSATPVVSASAAGTPDNEGLMASVDFEDEAAQEISPKNYEQELDKLEKDVSQ